MKSFLIPGLPVIFACLALGAARPPTEDKPAKLDTSMARANPLLRAAMAANHPDHTDVQTGAISSGSAEAVFLEQWVDRQIDRFAAEVVAKLDAMQAAMDTAEAAAEKQRSGSANTPRDYRLLSRKALVELEQQARSLRTLLAVTLVDLRTTDQSKPVIRRRAELDGFAQETALLSAQVDNADLRVREYLFRPTHTVGVEELRSGDILDLLVRVQKTAKAILGRMRTDSPGAPEQGR
jgi:hypothetical protein